MHNDFDMAWFDETQNTVDRQILACISTEYKKISICDNNRWKSLIKVHHAQCYKREFMSMNVERNFPAIKISGTGNVSPERPV